jgi:Sulfotransferase domain
MGGSRSRGTRVPRVNVTARRLSIQARVRAVGAMSFARCAGVPVADSKTASSRAKVAANSSGDRATPGVPEYFRGREQDLLGLDICAGEGWERLALFLGSAIPGQAFPHRNEMVPDPADER